MENEPGEGAEPRQDQDEEEEEDEEDGQMPAIRYAGEGEHMLDVAIGAEEEVDSDDSHGYEEDEAQAGAGAPAPSHSRQFDRELPAQHTYLGESVEVGGRTILEEDLVQELVIVPDHNLVLMPGQTLPLHIFRPRLIALMKKLIETTKTFGSLNISYDPTHSSHVSEAEVGTTAEIYEFRDPPETSNEVGLRLKVRGRQRFRLLSSREQIDGTRIATVEILKEKVLADPFADIRLRQDLKRCNSHLADDDRDQPLAKVRKHSSGMQSKFSDIMTRIKELGRHQDSSKDQHSAKPDSLKRASEWSPVVTPFPKWVFEMYNANSLVQRVQKMLTSLSLYSQSKVSVPNDPVELSFWIAINLPIEDSHRRKILELNCAVQRLRYELSVLKKCEILCCRQCGVRIAQQEDIFSMSQEGPQNAYVNPGGHVHETLTLAKAQNVTLIGSPSTEHSWFPGYSWTIAQCGCGNHLGWKFIATNKKLLPKKFWGLSHQSLRALSEIESQATSQDEDFLPVM